MLSTIYSKNRVTSEGTLEFCVKWFSYSEQTWEPRRNIPEELNS